MVILISDENKVGKNMSTNSIYKLTGRVDGSNAGQYQIEISNLVKTGSQSFTIDLSELVYISSVGLRVFLKTAKDLQVQNRKFILSKPNSLNNSSAFFFPSLLTFSLAKISFLLEYLPLNSSGTLLIIADSKAGSILNPYLILYFNALKITIGFCWQI